MKSMNGRTLLTLKEVAEYLKISETTLYILVRQGEIPAVKVANKWGLEKEILTAGLKSRPNKSAGQNNE